MIEILATAVVAAIASAIPLLISWNMLSLERNPKKSTEKENAYTPYSSSETPSSPMVSTCERSDALGHNKAEETTGMPRKRGKNNQFEIAKATSGKTKSQLPSSMTARGPITMSSNTIIHVHKSPGEIGIDSIIQHLECTTKGTTASIEEIVLMDILKQLFILDPTINLTTQKQSLPSKERYNKILRMLADLKTHLRAGGERQEMPLLTQLRAPGKKQILETLSSDLDYLKLNVEQRLPEDAADHNVFDFLILGGTTESCIQRSKFACEEANRILNHTNAGSVRTYMVATSGERYLFPPIDLQYTDQQSNTRKTANTMGGDATIEALIDGALTKLWTMILRKARKDITDPIIKQIAQNSAERVRKWQNLSPAKRYTEPGLTSAETENSAENWQDILEAGIAGFDAIHSKAISLAQEASSLLDKSMTPRMDGMRLLLERDIEQIGACCTPEQLFSKVYYLSRHLSDQLAESILQEDIIIQMRNIRESAEGICARIKDATEINEFQIHAVSYNYNTYETIRTALQLSDTDISKWQPAFTDKIKQMVPSDIANRDKLEPARASFITTVTKGPAVRESLLQVLKNEDLTQLVQILKTCWPEDEGGISSPTETDSLCQVISTECQGVTRFSTDSLVLIDSPSTIVQNAEHLEGSTTIKRPDTKSTLQEASSSFLKEQLTDPSNNIALITVSSAPYIQYQAAIQSKILLENPDPHHAEITLYGIGCSNNVEHDNLPAETMLQLEALISNLIAYLEVQCPKDECKGIAR